MFRYTILLATCMGAPALAAPSVTGVPLVAAGHHDALDVQVNWLGDGALRLAADCSGCIDDVQLREWTAADSPSARRPLPARIAFDAGTDDAITAKLATRREGAIAVDVLVAWTDAGGARRETTRTFFARFGKQGELTPISWAEFAVDRGFAARSSGRDGGTRLELDLEVAGNPEVQP